jgi:pilus assembly protein CpaE
MVILIVSDCQVRATRLRHVLQLNGSVCPLANVVPFETVTSADSAVQLKPDVILVVLAADPDRSQAVVMRLRESFKSHILAIGPRDPNLILAALHSGANDYIDESGDLQKELSSSIGRLSESDREQSSSGQLISVIAAGGGTGRTSLATNLAVALANRFGQCGLFDLDFGGADVATYMNLKARHTIADLCRSIDKLDQKMLEQSLVQHESGASVLAAPEVWDDTRHITVEGLQKVLRFGRSLFRHVVVDLDAFWMGEYGHLLQQSSAILLLFRLDLASIRNARRALQTLDKLSVDRGNVQLIAARCGGSKDIAADQAESVLDTQIRHSIPEDARAVSSCINCGVPIVMESPWSPVAKAILGIASTFSEPGTAAGLAAHQAKSGASLQIMEKVSSFFAMSARALAQSTRVSSVESVK